MGTAAQQHGGSGPVVLFDGVCKLCNGAVLFIIRRDPAARFRFAALQSEAGRAMLAGAGLGVAPPDSLVLIAEGAAFVRSGAALRIARRLTWPWSWLWVLVVVPRPLRDWAYDFIAARRYRWFGRRDACMMPTPELRARFIDGDAASG